MRFTLAMVLKYMRAKRPSPRRKKNNIITSIIRPFVRLYAERTALSPTNCFQVLRKEKIRNTYYEE